MTKIGDGRHTYAMFNKVLPLAFNLSSMHAKISINLLTQFRIHKRKVSFSGIINHGNKSPIIPFLVHYEWFYRCTHLSTYTFTSSISTCKV